MAADPGLSESAMTDVVIPLRRNLRFQTFWTGSASATLGQAVGDVAYPLAIVTMTGSPGKAALFSAVQIAGMLVAGLPVGSLADRYDSQRLALVAHAIRTMVACVVAIALAGGWLTLPLLVAAAVVLGAGQALGGATNILLLRSIVPGEQLTLALTQDEVRISGASLAGPALAGALYSLHHVAPFTFTAAAFFLALTATALLPAGLARPAPSEEPAEGGMLAGIRELWGQPVLRAAVMLIMGVNTVGAGLELVVIVILRHQAVPPYAIGLALGIGAAGGLAGAPLVKFLHRLPPGVLLLVVCGMEVPVLLLLAVPFGPWWAAGVLFTGLLGVPGAARPVRHPGHPPGPAGASWPRRGRGHDAHRPGHARRHRRLRPAPAVPPGPDRDADPRRGHGRRDRLRPVPSRTPPRPLARG